MNAKEFENSIKKLRSELEVTNRSPRKMSELVFERLKMENSVYDTTILELVYAWRNFESENQSGEKFSFSETIDTIDLLLNFTKKRVQLHAALLSVKGDILFEISEPESAAEAFAGAVSELHPLHLDVDVQRIGNMVKLGQTLFSLDKKKEAERIYLDVLSYPWYLVMENEIREILQNYYIQAGSGLIECRKGDLEALEETYFVPATHSKLLPELERAIRDTKDMM